MQPACVIFRLSPPSSLQEHLAPSLTYRCVWLRAGLCVCGRVYASSTRYLWPHFSPETASKAHLISIVLVVNEKFLEGHEPWATFVAAPAQFPGFMQRVFAASLATDDVVSVKERTVLVKFLARCFQGVEQTLVREALQPVMGLGTWRCLSAGRLEEELGTHAQ